MLKAGGLWLATSTTLFALLVSMGWWEAVLELRLVLALTWLFCLMLGAAVELVLALLRIFARWRKGGG